VVLALHPTPAVGGVPARAALRFIADREALDRGLYAGLVGLCGPGRADLAVALRCALVTGSAARLFVGAGVVAGSTAESEWAETELKTRALLGALGAPA
jgi:isochorismate synthase EntC